MLILFGSSDAIVTGLDGDRIKPQSSYVGSFHSRSCVAPLPSFVCFYSIAAVESVQSQGKICILDIDVQGVQKVKQSSLDPHYVFIAPPSREELEKRLRGRGTESEEAMATRLANAAQELEYGQTTGNFERVFVNADLHECFESMVAQFKEWYPHLVEVAPDDEQKHCTCVVS